MLQMPSQCATTVGTYATFVLSCARRVGLQSYCNRASANRYAADVRVLLTAKNPINKLKSRTHQDGL